MDIRETIRLLFITGLSPIMGLITPTQGFLLALIIMFAFNIWAGMRADGITIVRCKNFRFKKFKNALMELFLYIVIMQTIHRVMVLCGDDKAAIYVIKSLTYVFMYVYLQNAFKNLTIAYPKIVALHLIYHLIRLEFTRLLPSYWKPIVERYEKERKEKENEKREQR